MWLLTLLLLLKNSITQTTPTYLRKTTISNKYMQTLSFCYYPVVNAGYYSLWTTPINTYYSDTAKYNLQFQYTTSLNSISSGATTYGYDIALRVASIWDTGITLSISDTSVANKYFDPAVWFSVRIFIFLLPNDVPFEMLTISKMVYSSIGQNLYTLTNQTYTLQFGLNPSFAPYCFYDPAKTIRDKIHLLPSLLQFSIINPVYVNLSSSSNWAYDWDTTTTSLYFNLTISTYTSQFQYFVMDVMGICPNSYTYAQNNLSMGISIKNWFNLQPSNSIANKYTNVMLQYPFANDTAVMIGMPITGLSIYTPNFNILTALAGTSLLIVSFNISQGYDSNGGYTGYMGNLSYNIVNPQNCYGYYYMFGLIGGCPNNLIQYNTTHCICPNGTSFSYTSGSCLNCIQLFGSNCGTCNTTNCLSCIVGLYFYQSGSKSLCINCTQSYGSQCGQCSDTVCLNCNNNYTLNASNKCECHLFDNFIDIITGVCLHCPFKFSFCINCTYNGCFGCMDRFTLSNNSCICFLPNILALGSCFSCFDLFGLGCILCNSSNCLNCDANFQMINNTCKCLGQGLTLFNSSCLKCSELFGIGCLNCNLTSCSSCAYNFQLNAPNCTCPPSTYTISNNTCQSCTDLFDYCLQCSNMTCNRCLNNFNYSNDNCTCQGDRYLTLGGGCQLCTNVYDNCLICNRTTCWSCVDNFTLSNGTCSCAYPMVYWQSRCMQCLDLNNPSLCSSVQASLQYYQSGISLYFWLKYSSQVALSSPIQFNIDLRMNNTPISFTYAPQTGIFKLDLTNITGNSYVTVQVLNQQSIVADNRPLIYHPVAFTVSPVSEDGYFSLLISYVATIRNYAIVVCLVLCFGVFNKLSRSLSIVVVMWLSQSNLPNSMGIINDLVNNNTPLYFANVQLGWNLQRLECTQLRFVAYGLNKSIIDLSFQLYIAAIASVLLVAYVRGYLQTKPNAKQYLGWRNILAHSKEYLLQNILSLHGLLCLPALLQLKLIASIGAASMAKNIHNLIFSAYLLCMPCVLTALCLLRCKYEPVLVGYNGVGASRLGVANWLLATLQPYVISMACLFLPSQANLYLMIAVNALSLIVWLVSLQVVRNKVDYIFVILKQVCVLFVSITLLFNGQDWVLLKVACYCSIIICLTQLLEIVYKTVMMLLVNKGVISHRISSSAMIANQYSAFNKLELAAKAE